MREVLAQLSEPLRVTLDLHYMEDMNLVQIAAYLGVPLGTVKHRLSDGRARFAKLWRRRFPDEVLCHLNHAEKGRMRLQQGGGRQRGHVALCSSARPTELSRT